MELEIIQHINHKYIVYKMKYFLESELKFFFMTRRGLPSKQTKTKTTRENNQGFIYQNGIEINENIDSKTQQ